MPYKDVERKKEWERLHRPERQARQRELRRLGVEQRASRPETPRIEDSGLDFLIPLVAGSAVAIAEPELGLGIGSLTLVIASIYKKGWKWWVFGVVVLAVALIFYSDKQKNTAQSRSEKEK